ncbi:hypothetical protein [Gemmatimonas sp.]|uniref:hypothetical protein n=1 Tax=Gemmatimonas sp. TaxID=1962908 RepID=UPI002EDAE748
MRDGRGGHVLCGDCNHRTGGSYGGAFVEWSRIGMERLYQVRGKRSLNFHGDIYPLRVLKQIATIFFATCQPEFRSRHPELERFVLDERRTGLPEHYDFRVFWYGGGSLRQTGVVGALNTATGNVHVLAEFVHPPFGYVLSFDTPPGEHWPERISDFSRYDYDTRISLNRRFPVLETHWIIPGDYRTQEEIRRDQMINALDEHGVRNPQEIVAEMERVGMEYNPDAI